MRFIQTVYNDIMNIVEKIQTYYSSHDKRIYRNQRIKHRIKYTLDDLSISKNYDRRQFLWKHTN